MAKKSISLSEMVRQHNLHSGVYVRVASKLGIDPSLVSKVANGKRRSDTVEKALISELQRISYRGK